MKHYVVIMKIQIIIVGLSHSLVPVFFTARYLHIIIRDMGCLKECQYIVPTYITGIFDTHSCYTRFGHDQSRVKVVPLLYRRHHCNGQAASPHEVTYILSIIIDRRVCIIKHILFYYVVDATFCCVPIEPTITSLHEHTLALYTFINDHGGLSDDCGVVVWVRRDPGEELDINQTRGRWQAQNKYHHGPRCLLKSNINLDWLFTAECG